MANVPASVALVGPPEARAMARSAAPAPVPTPVTTVDASITHKSTPCSDPFIDLMVEKFNKSLGRPAYSKPPRGMGLTENLSPTFLTSGNPCLDFFFQVVPDTQPAVVADLLASAWSQEALTTLKLVCHLRGVRGTGKSDKEGFYTAALWLHRNHPKTLALNVPSIARFGYIKDLPEILYRLLNGADVRKIAKEEREAKTRSWVNRGWGCGRGRGRRRGGFGGWGKGRGKRGGCTGLNAPLGAEQQKESKKGTREERVAAELARVKIAMEDASQMRKKKRADMASRALDRYRNDPDYRLLHDCIAEFLATQLVMDMKNLCSGKANKVGLAAKWCPSLDSSFDLSTLLCESVARRVFPRESHPEYEGVEEEHYAYRVRDRLRKEVLVPLRAALQLPEVYMSANRWAELPYSRVASVAMKTYQEHFKKHDGERFAEFLGQVRKGEAKIAAGALLPHQIVKQVMTTSCYAWEEDGQKVEEDDEVAELQWQRMVSDLKQKGKLHNCLAVCDVSGSMSGTPMEVSVALGLLTSELCEEPWKGKVITFSETPELHTIAGESLREKASFVLEMDWGGNTDFQAVFDRILELAVTGGLPPEKMVKRVFVFSDMEFDEASANPWETDHQAIKRKYQESGYGEAIPEIVFWNLRDSRSTPVPSGQDGVALVSGFSKNLMTVFLDGDGVLKPEDVMNKAIAGKEYSDLSLFD